MIPMPSPLHPALVHFPIVLLLIGVPVAMAALFVRKAGLAWLTALLLAGAALGAVLAVRAGGQDAEMAGTLNARAEAALDDHEEWGERTRAVALLAAGLAVAALVLRRWPRIAFAAQLATAVAAIAGALCVAWTGHYGGQLVYAHGIGINVVAADTPPEGATAPAAAGEDADAD